MDGYFKDQNITVAAIVIYAVIAICVYFLLPYLMRTQFGKAKKDHRQMLGFACIVFFVSIFLPSPLIHGENTNFTTHFIGGGIFTGLIWLYIKDYTGWRANWSLELGSLYLLVCGLGVTNELLEFFANSLGIVNIPGTDTWWDLLANTAGALCFWIVYRLKGAK